MSASISELGQPHAWQGESGNAEHETVVTITLTDLGRGRTQLTFHQAFRRHVAFRIDGNEIVAVLGSRSQRPRTIRGARCPITA
ncbi:hypothetical protein SM0020_03250 [Sinorhizobium meliloti CCNWSX0020]|uniref:Uncharacterized protein n=1 Tax=Sinorhizobium meliloti CCNWSX0020 TaxID=1107881 RepID=H0FU25_RHIML|nr:hypothetical protein SM0020_03250 [Sinorhizobium meliloti CCNWSX0020]